MKTQLLFVALVFVFLVVFLVFGMPYLKTIRQSSGLSFGRAEGNMSGRVVPPIDITIEDICLNIVTGDIDQKCQTQSGCDQMCKSKGCSLFGLIYNSSSYKESRCFCNCIEPNKIKKALNLD